MIDIGVAAMGHISLAEAPREIAFMPTDGVGPHLIWYVGGPYAYLSIHFADFTDPIT